MPLDLVTFPRTTLAHLPTRFEELTRLRAALGPDVPRIWVKRDDCTGLATGGNKTRKLEFLIGDALSKGAASVVTVGALQSNHVRQTAAAAAACGLTCDAILFRAVDRSDVHYLNAGNILLDRILGARITMIDPDALEDTISVTMEKLRAEGQNPYLVPYGGSSAEGALGYVNAFLEIASDCADAGLEPAAIYHASSSGATQAGLCVGAAGSGSNIRILGVNVLKPMVDDLKDEVAQLVAATALLAGVDPEAAKARVELCDGQLGTGYGEPTPAMLEAVSLVARTEGLLLDPVYSGKALAGLIADVRAGQYAKDQAIVFLHTGGAAALHAYPDIVTTS